MFLVRPTRDARQPAVFWSLVASASVGAGIVIALRPGQLADLHLVRAWVNYWLTTGGDPYTAYRFQADDPGLGATLDYPPMAFLLLWPLALLPQAAIASWYLPIAVVTTCLAEWLLLQWLAGRMGVELSTSHRIALVAIIVAGSGARSALWRGQTVAIGLFFGALVLQWCRARPWTAALALALCSFKPHLAIGFGLAALFGGGLRAVVIGLLMAMAGTWMFALTIGRSLLGIVVDYGHNLAALYGYRENFRGRLSIRGVLDQWLPAHPVSTVAYVVLALGCIAAIVVLSRRRQRDAVNRLHTQVACLLWSVVFLPHQTYDTLMLAPALWLLMWPESGLVRSPSLRLAATAAYVLFGVIDPPRVIRLVAPWVQPDSTDLFYFSYFLNPLRTAMLFVIVLVALYRRSQAPVFTPMSGA